MLKRCFCGIAHTLAVRGVSDVFYSLFIDISSTEGWFGILSGTQEKIVFLFLSRLTNTLGLPFKIVIESRITHASSSSQEAILRKTAVRGSREERERSQSVPLALPASYSLFLTLFK